MSLPGLIQGSRDRLEVVFYDQVRDTATDTYTLERIDLSNATAIELQWSLNGVLQTALTLTADPDQVARKGVAYRDLASGDLSAPGEARILGKWTDVLGKTHYTERVIEVVHPNTP